MKPSNIDLIKLHLSGFIEDSDSSAVLLGTLFIKGTVTIQTMYTQKDLLLWSVDTTFDYPDDTRPVYTNYITKRLDNALANAAKLRLHQQEIANETN